MSSWRKKIAVDYVFVFQIPESEEVKQKKLELNIQVENAKEVNITITCDPITGHISEALFIYHDQIHNHRP